MNTRRASTYRDHLFQRQVELQVELEIGLSGPGAAAYGSKAAKEIDAERR